MAKNNDHILVRDSYKNVLIIRFSALGDVAMTIPVVYSVCQAHPDTHFVMLTLKAPASLFVNAPANLEVMGIDVRNDYRGLCGIHRLYKHLCETHKIDVVIDLHDVVRTWILGFFFTLAGIPVKRIDKGRRGKRALTRSRNKKMFPLISSRERYREVFYRAGFAFQETFKSLFHDNQATPACFASICAPKADGMRWVAIAPFAKHPGKIYPLDLMIKVVDEIAAWPKVHIFLFGGGEDERNILAEWEKRHSNITSLAGQRHGFATELALLSQCDVMVSMDSANMHLASLVCLPVVSIWGATHPYCGFMGWHQDPQNVIQLNMLCRPCSVFGNKPCRYHDLFCLKGIAPSLITTRVNQILENMQ